MMLTNKTRLVIFLRTYNIHTYKYIQVSLSREKTVKLYSKLSNLIATTTTHGRGHALHNKIKCRVSSNLDDQEESSVWWDIFRYLFEQICDYVIHNFVKRSRKGEGRNRAWLHILKFTIKHLVKLGHSQKIALGSIQFIARGQNDRSYVWLGENSWRGEE